jgi:hypothetical protein
MKNDQSFSLLILAGGGVFAPRRAPIVEQFKDDPGVEAACCHGFESCDWCRRVGCIGLGCHWRLLPDGFVHAASPWARSAATAATAGARIAASRLFCSTVKGGAISTSQRRYSSVASPLAMLRGSTTWAVWPLCSLIGEDASLPRRLALATTTTKPLDDLGVHMSSRQTDRPTPQPGIAPVVGGDVGWRGKRNPATGDLVPHDSAVNDPHRARDLPRTSADDRVRRQTLSGT